MRNVKVKLRDQVTSLRCPLTGWEITRTEEKNTPKEHSERIASWIRAGALVLVEDENSPKVRFAALLGQATKGMNLESLQTLAVSINKAVSGDDKTIADVITVEGSTVKSLQAQINAWKKGVESDGK